MLEKLPKALLDFAAVFKKAGKACYLVGGATRNLILGRPVNDYDVATDARPEEVRSLFKRVIATGIEHGTVTVRFAGLSIETTTFRVEVGYSDGRRPDKVSFSPSILEDLARRDFTMNAIALDLESGELLDPHGGREDMARGLIRAIGNPDERFGEDGLRPLRALRFASQLGYRIEDGTYAAIPRSAERFTRVSAERVRDEFEKILLSHKPSYGLRLLEGSGLLGLFLPELLACRGIRQGGYHAFDVLDHLFGSCDASRQTTVARLAALFHDIGKPLRAELKSEGIWSFHRHEEDSALIAEKCLKRLRFPNTVIEEVVLLVASHMFNYTATWTDAAVRRFISRSGAVNMEGLFDLRRADVAGMGGSGGIPRELEELEARVRAEIAKSSAFSLKDLAIDGEDLAALGYPRGPLMGMALKEILEAVLDDPGLNEKGRLLDIASRMKSRFGIGE